MQHVHGKSLSSNEFSFVYCWANLNLGTMPKLATNGTLTLRSGLGLGPLAPIPCQRLI